MIASQLDRPRLRKGLSRMKPSALGLDGWSVADLRSLPDRLLGWLADLLREVERIGKWPTRLAEGYTALIPKEGPPGPLNTRPLTVLSMVYWLWVGLRLVDAIAWQEAWAHPAAFGFRPARSAPDGAAVTQVLLEPCRLRGRAVAGMSIDYAKCFDLFPKRSCWPLRWSRAWTRARVVPWGPCTSSSAGPSRSRGPSASGGRPPTASSRDAHCR